MGSACGHLYKTPPYVLVARGEAIFRSLVNELALFSSRTCKPTTIKVILIRQFRRKDISRLCKRWSTYETRTGFKLARGKKMIMTGKMNG